MKVIHAYRRKEATTVELFGLSIEFKPNDKKDVVAEVDHEEAVDRLLSIREAYRLYAHQPAAPVAALQHATAVQALESRVPFSSTVSTAASIAASAASDTGNQQTEASKPVDAGEPVTAQQTSASGESGMSDQGSGATESKEPGESQSQYVFTNEDGDSIDISKWTAAQIRDFAEANTIELPKGNSVKVSELRDLLAAALRAGSKE